MALPAGWLAVWVDQWKDLLDIGIGCLDEVLDGRILLPSFGCVVLLRWWWICIAPIVSWVLLTIVALHIWVT
jgi:hypothetical protein